MKVTIILYAAKQVHKNYTRGTYREDSEVDINEEFGIWGTYHCEYEEYLTQDEIREIHDFFYGILINEE